MEWERRGFITEVSSATASRLTQPYFKQNLPIKIRLLRGGKLNTNYYLKTLNNNREYALRIHNNNGKILKKEEWISNLVGDSVNTPKYYYVNSITNNVLGKPYALTEWIHGRHLKLESLSDEIDLGFKAKKLGELLGRLRNFTFEHEGFFNEEFIVPHPEMEYKEFYRSFIKEKLFSPLVLQRLSASLCNDVWSFVNAHYLLLDQKENQNYLIHGDFNFSNILLVENADGNKNYVLLDWEFAFSGSQLFDIGNLFRYDEKLPKVFKYNFLEGYLECGGYLPKDWLHIAKLLDLLNLCDLLSNEGNFKNLFVDVEERMRRTLELEDNINDEYRNP